MSMPDYESYSLRDLIDVLNNIDRDKYPDRVQAIENILNDNEKYLILKAQHEEMLKQEEADDFEDEEPGAAIGFRLIVTAILLLSTGSLHTDFGAIYIESLGMRIFISVLLLLGSLALILDANRKNKVIPKSK